MSPKRIKDQPSTIATLAAMRDTPSSEPFVDFLERIGDIDLDRPQSRDYMRVRAASSALIKKLHELMPVDTEATP